MTVSTWMSLRVTRYCDATIMELEKMCLLSYANNKGADQPAHPRSLISAFVVRCLDSITSLDSIAEISRLQLASVAAQAGLCLAWSETPEDTFCHVVAHIDVVGRENTKRCWSRWMCRLICSCVDHIWATSWQNQQNSMCAQQRLRSAQSDQSPRCPAWRKLGSLATHWAHSEDWSDWADAGVFSGHTCHFVGFVMRSVISTIL